MEDEKKEAAATPQEPSENGGGIDYASMIAKTKNYYEAEMSRREAASQEQIDKLTQMIVNGRESTPKSEPTPVKVKSRLELYKDYKENKPCSNAEYWQRQLDLREATIREYGKDPWVSGNYGEPAPGQRLNVSYEEGQAMEELAGQIQLIIDESEGDPDKFNFLMNAAVK